MKEQRMFSLRVVKSLEDLESISDRWNTLLEESSADNIFLTWEWVYTWTKHYLGSNQLWTIVVSNADDQLIGIAPLYIRTARSYGGFRLRELRFLGTEEVCSCYLDFIVPDKQRKAVLFSIYRHLHEEAAGKWDLLTLAEVPAESSTIDIWDEFVQEDGKVVEVVGFSSCPIINVSDRSENVLTSMSAKKRQTIGRKRRLLEKEGRVAYQQATSLQEIEKDLDAFIQLHQMRWERSGGMGAFHGERFTKFHREICQVLGQKGWVQLDFLLLNGEKIAGIYGYSYKGRYLYYLPGFNPNVLPESSPGTLLLFQRIEEAIRQGCVQVDLLRGVADYKIAMANGLRRSLTLRHHNRSLRAAMLKFIECVRDVGKVLVR